MNWVIFWLLVPAAWVALASAGGFALGHWWHHSGVGAWVGALLAVFSLAAVTVWRASRFLSWLSDPRGLQPPQGHSPSGYWGELFYRVDRLTRERERALEEEKSRLQRFLNAIEASPNGVLMLDAEDRIRWLNSVAALHFGLSPVRDLEQHVTNLLRAPSFVQHMQSGAYTDAADPVVMPGAGQYSSLSVVVRPYGEGLKLLLSQDVTDSERQDSMRRDFVANVSHEIRTPLTVLAGFIETLSSLPLTEAERRRVLELMTQQTHRMQLLVADLLTLAQLEGSPSPAPDRWVHTAKLLERVEQDGLSLSGGRHRLSLAGQAFEAEVAGTEAELLSAMGNLVSNAVRYTPAGGDIQLRWGRRPDGGAEFEVRDSGPGIAREHLPRLTERFYRVDGSRSRDTGGTGLGLSIVKHVVQRHGGELDIQSEIGKGSAFKVVLPASRLRWKVAGV
jgi:two-component system phosphate regulon sensor histidine kinase PhoR